MLLITFPLLAVLLLVAAAPSGAVKCPSVAFVVHSNARNDHVTDFMSNTFLKDTNLVVVSGHDTFDTVVEHRRSRHKKKRRNLRRVIYNGNPGGRQTFRTGGGNYLGTHRTLAGVLMAMDLHPEVDWVYVMDDDNVVNVDQICDRLSTENASIPLLLGSVGPTAGGHAPCRETSSEDGNHFTCCTDPKHPCIANLTSPYPSAMFVYDKDADTMLPQKCGSGGSCCEVVAWPEGIMYGYPYRLRTPADVGMKVYSTHVVHLWPYGGNTYVISKGMFNSIGRDNWEKYMYMLQCSNADINIMTVVLNHGYSIHEYRHFTTIHHVHTIEAQFGSFKGSRQPREIYDTACELYPALRNITNSRC